MYKLLILFILIPNLVFATCDSGAIMKIENGYLYTTECHKYVGKKLQQGKLNKEALGETKKALEKTELALEVSTETIKLKDLTIDTHTKRADMWKESTYKLEDRLFKIERLKSSDNWIWFGLGIFVMGAATYGASRLRK